MAADVALSGHIPQCGVSFLLSGQQLSKAGEGCGLAHSDAVDETRVRRHRCGQTAGGQLLELMRGCGGVATGGASHRCEALLQQIVHPGDVTALVVK